MKKGLFIRLGLILILLGFGWLRLNDLESDDAAQASSMVLTQLEQSIPELSQSTDIEERVLADDAAMVEVEFGGINYIGVLEIPSLELTLPIISIWSEENGKIAPCRYSGSVQEKNLVICAHNYKSHFGRLSLLESGDLVVLTDAGGNLYSYQVTEKHVLDGTALQEMESGEWDLTLFTCTNRGKSRYTVRCKQQG